MRADGEAAKLLKHQVCLVERQSRCPVKKIVLSAGREYIQDSMYPEAQGTEVCPNATYTPLDNGRGKWMSRKIKNRIPALLIQAAPSSSFCTKSI